MDQYPKLVRNQWSGGGHNYTLWVAAEVYVLLSEDDVLSLQAQIAQDRELPQKRA
jgi:hypothetical protein